MFALVVLLAMLIGGHASLRVSFGVPQIVEFGPTFRSALCGIAIGSDDAIWAEESDGVARLSRDREIAQIRRPDDGPGCDSELAGIGIGPGGAVWTNGTDWLLRFTETSVRPFERVTSSDYRQRFDAFLATPDGVYTSRDSESGVRRFTPDRASQRLCPDVDHVRYIVAGREGALWLLSGPENWRYASPGQSLSLDFYSPAHIARHVAAKFLAGHTFEGHFAGAADGGLLADVAVVGEPTSSLVHIAPDGSVAELTRLPDVTSPSQVGAIAPSRDGTIWLSEPYANRLVSVSPNGLVRVYRDNIPSGSAPTGVAVDDDGSVWYTDAARATIGHLTPADGRVRIFGNGLAPINVPGPPVVSNDGALWFREENPGHPRIARLAPDGTLREFTDPLKKAGTWGGPNSMLGAAGNGVVLTNGAPEPRASAVTLSSAGIASNFSLDGCLQSDTNFACFPNYHGQGSVSDPRAAPTSVVLGPDGNLWFTDVIHSAIGRVSRDGRCMFFTRGLTRWHSGPQYITIGPDGALWFTELRDRVGRITLDGRITEFSGGIPFRSSLGGIVAGPDKNLWFTLYHGNELVRMSPAGIVRRFRRGIYPSHGSDTIADSVPFIDRAGHIWFNEPQGGRIARATILLR